MIGVLGVAAVSAMIGHAPERLRPLVIMPALFGLLTGWGMRTVSQELGLRRSWWRAAATGLLAVAGLVNVSWLSFDRLADTARSNVKEDSQQLIGLQLLRSDADASPERLERLRMQLSPSFADYLMGRLLGVAWLPRPWPAVIWGTELAIAAGLAIWCVRRPSGEAPVAGPTDKPAGRPDEERNRQ